MWLTPLRPCCSSRTAASSSRSSTACEYESHPCPASQVRLFAGCGLHLPPCVGDSCDQKVWAGSRWHQLVWGPEASTRWPHPPVTVSLLGRASLLFHPKASSLLHRRASIQVSVLSPYSKSLLWGSLSALLWGSLSA